MKALEELMERIKEQMDEIQSAPHEEMEQLMDQMEQQVGEEHLPPLGHGVEMIVPLAAVPESAVDQPHDARPAVSSFDEPLERETSDAFAAVEDDADAASAAAEMRLKSGDEIAAEIQEFLRDNPSS